MSVTVGVFVRVAAIGGGGERHRRGVCPGRRVDRRAALRNPEGNQEPPELRNVSLLNVEGSGEPLELRNDLLLNPEGKPEPSKMRNAGPVPLG